MDIEQYQNLTGITVTESNEARITALIAKTQTMLEGMLGYTLNPSLTNANQLSSEEPIGAYRIFPYNKKDKFLAIDPAIVVHSVSILKNGELTETFDLDNYLPHSENGIIKYLEKCDTDYPWCGCREEYCDCGQLAVDADWLWDDYENTLPDDLLYLWADMITHYGDPKFGLKKQSLDTHSWEKADGSNPEDLVHNAYVLTKYAGPNGSVYKTVVL